MSKRQIKSQIKKLEAQHSDLVIQRQQSHWFDERAELQVKMGTIINQLIKLDKQLES